MKLIDRWIEALRSDEYQQTRYTLRGDSGFCCLGVLTYLTNPEHPSLANGGVMLPNDIVALLDAEEPAHTVYVNERMYLEVPPELRTHDIPTRVTATKLNDTYEMSFKDIAACVEYTFRSLRCETT